MASLLIYILIEFEFGFGWAGVLRFGCAGVFRCGFGCFVFEYGGYVNWENAFWFCIKSGYFESDVCVGCSLIDMFAKGRGDLISAYKMFEKMSEKNGCTMRNVVMGLAEGGLVNISTIVTNLWNNKDAFGYVKENVA